MARAYDLHPNQLYPWRTEYFRGDYGAVSTREALAATFLAVEVADMDEMPKDVAVADTGLINQNGPEPAYLLTLRLILKPIAGGGAVK